MQTCVKLTELTIDLSSTSEMLTYAPVGSIGKHDRDQQKDAHASYSEIHELSVGARSRCIEFATERQNS